MSSPIGMATKEILLRISGDYAMQCKLVSRQWRGLIESESFMRAYCLRKSVGGSGFSFAPLQKLLQQAPSDGTWLETKVVCSKPCNGLNLISNYKEDYLYNPCTGYQRIFPSRFRLMDAISDGWTIDGHAFAVGNKIAGLGFNLLRQEHVIVEILYHSKDFTARRYSLSCSVVGCTSGPGQVYFELPCL
jgi:hypothetical protein